MSRRCIVLISLALSLSAAAILTAQETPPPELAGVVRDGTGRPVPGAWVGAVVASARRRSEFEPVKTSTDEQGRFRLNLDSDGTHRVIVLAKGFAPHEDELEVTGSTIEVTLRVGETLSGVVLDGRARRPVAGARVSTLSAPSLSTPLLSAGERDRLTADAITDEHGRFRLRGLLAGPRTVTAAAPGYARAEKQTSSLDPVELFLFAGASLYGRVVDSDGEPVEGARLNVLNRIGSGVGFFRTSNITASSDREGHFELLGVGDGTFRIVIDHPDYAVTQTPPIDVGNEDLVLDEIRLVAGGVVTGRVADVAGAPLEGSVWLEGTPGMFGAGGQRAETKEGEFRLDRIPEGEHRLLVEPEGFAARRIDVFVAEPGDEVDLGTITFERGLTIEGYVVDETGTALPDTDVYASVPRTRMSPFATGTGMPVRAVSDEEGRFVLAGLETGAYQLWATSPGYVPPEELVVEAGTLDVVLALAPTASVVGRVVDGDGNPMSSFEVTVEPTSRSRSFSRGRRFADATAGTFEVEDLAEGTYVVIVEAEGMKPEQISRVAVVPGRKTDVGTLVLHPGGTLRGNVGDVRGNPIPGAQIALDFGRRNLDVQSDAAGYFEFSGLERGVYDLFARHPDYADESIRDVELRSETDPLDVTIQMHRGGTLEGVVQNRYGVGIEGRRVSVGRGRGVGPVTTDASGFFRVERIPAGIQPVRLLAAGDFPVTLQQREVEIVEGETRFIELESREVRIRGRVSKNGVGLAGARVNLRPLDTSGSFFVRGASEEATGPLPLNAVTEPDGYFEMLVDYPGEYWVRAVPATGGGALPRKKVTIPDTDVHTVEIDFSAVTVFGHVVDEDEQPIAKASIAVFGPVTTPVATPLGSARSDVGGTFQLELDPGEYRLRASANRLAPVEQRLVVTEGGVPDVYVVLSKGGSIRGRALGPDGGDPGRYYVSIVDDDGNPMAPPRFTDWAEIHSDGMFEIHGLAENVTYNLLIGSDLLGFAFAPAVAPGQDVTVRLRPPAWVDVLVRGPDGMPVRGARLALAAIGGRKTRGVFGRTDDVGRASLYVPAGRLQIKAVDGDELQGAGRVSVQEGERAAVEITLQQVR